MSSLASIQEEKGTLTPPPTEPKKEETVIRYEHCIFINALQTVLHFRTDPKYVEQGLQYECDKIIQCLQSARVPLTAHLSKFYQNMHTNTLPLLNETMEDIDALNSLIEKIIFLHIKHITIRAQNVPQVPPDQQDAVKGMQEIAKLTFHSPDDFLKLIQYAEKADTMLCELVKTYLQYNFNIKA